MKKVAFIELIGNIGENYVAQYRALIVDGTINEYCFVDKCAKSKKLLVSSVENMSEDESKQTEITKEEFLKQIEGAVIISGCRERDEKMLGMVFENVIEVSGLIKDRQSLDKLKKVLDRKKLGCADLQSIMCMGYPLARKVHDIMYGSDKENTLS